MAIGEVASDAASNLGGLLTTGSLTQAATDWLNLQNNLFGGSSQSVTKTLTGRTLGDYTLVAVGIILAIGALLISAKPTVIKAVGTVKDAVTF